MTTTVHTPYAIFKVSSHQRELVGLEIGKTYAESRVELLRKQRPIGVEYYFVCEPLPHPLHVCTNPLLPPFGKL